MRMILSTFLCFLLWAGASPAEAAWRGHAVADVNMRSGPGVRYRVIAVVPRGGRVTVRYCHRTRAWCRVSWRRFGGWVSSHYIRATSRYVPYYDPPVYRRRIYRDPLIYAPRRIYRPRVYVPRRARPRRIYRPRVYAPRRVYRSGRVNRQRVYRSGSRSANRRNVRTRTVYRQSNRGRPVTLPNTRGRPVTLPNTRGRPIILVQ